MADGNEPPRRKIMGVEVPPAKREVAPRPPTQEPTVILPKQSEVEIFREEVRRSITPKSMRGAGDKDKAKGVKIILSSGAFLSLTVALWQGLPPILEALKDKAPPAQSSDRSDPVVTLGQPPQSCATQSSHDSLSAEVEKMKERMQRIAEVVCDANQGEPMIDFPCPQKYEYSTPQNPPPLRRTPRVYPK